MYIAEIGPGWTDVSGREKGWRIRDEVLFWRLVFLLLLLYLAGCGCFDLTCLLTVVMMALLVV